MDFTPVTNTTNKYWYWSCRNSSSGYYRYTKYENGETYISIIETYQSLDEGPTSPATLSCFSEEDKKDEFIEYLSGVLEHHEFIKGQGNNAVCLNITCDSLLEYEEKIESEIARHKINLI